MWDSMSLEERMNFQIEKVREDGFKRINQILKNRQNIDALHLIGHGSAGQILFGNAFLNNETIDNYKKNKDELDNLKCLYSCL